MKRVIRNGLAAGLALLAGILFAEVPQWWIERGVVNTNTALSDYAPVNQGQAKHIATKAYLEFDQKLTSDCSMISNLVSGFSETNNYLPINLGQLKFIATPFYDLLWTNDYTDAWPEGLSVGPYPWSGVTNSSQDYAIANIGQLKYLFSFNPEVVARDSDEDGLPDWWEIQYGLEPQNSEGDNGGAGDPDNDGLVNSDEFIEKTDPLNFDTDGDLLADGPELNFYQTEPLLFDTDADGNSDGVDQLTAWNSQTELILQLIMPPFPPNSHLALYGVTEGGAYEYYFRRSLITGEFLIGGAGLLAEVSGTFNFYNLWLGPGRKNTGQMFFKAGVSTDTDGDGLGGCFEVKVLGTSPDMEDTDGDGINDGMEDFDGDGKLNIDEYNSLANPVYYNPVGGYSSPVNPDTDGDGICDGPIVPVPYNLVPGPDAFPLDPAGSVDTDDDGYPDEIHGTSNSEPPLQEDLDDDNDGLPDVWEIQYGLDLKDATGDNGADGDPDRDDLTNIEEYQANSDPVDPDDPVPSPIHYVSLSGTHEAPYLTWATAATNIQDALDAAHDGDTVLVTNGTYRISEQISVVNSMTLLSVNGAENTVVDGGGSTRCIYLSNGTVDGFSITGGYTYNENGAGIYIAQGTIRNSSIHQNAAAGDPAKGNGAGIYVDVWSFLIENCLIYSNAANNNGGGIAVLVGVSGQNIRNCAIYDNTADWGGGIYSRPWGRSVNTLTIEGSTITRNTATGTGGGGIFLWNGTSYNLPMTVDIRNTISYFNDGVTDPNFKTEGSISLNITHSCITPLLAGQGNIADDPTLEEGDWHLEFGSPCIDAGTNAYASGSDLDGEPRIVNAVVDIGADEWVESDSDGDGLPDWWEIQYGLDSQNPNGDNGADGDPDGDGESNLDEYNAGTHPQIVNVTPPVGAQGRLIFRYDDDGRLLESHLNNKSAEVLELSPAHNVSRLKQYTD